MKISNSSYLEIFVRVNFATLSNSDSISDGSVHRPRFTIFSRARSNPSASDMYSSSSIFASCISSTTGSFDLEAELDFLDFFFLLPSVPPVALRLRPTVSLSAFWGIFSLILGFFFFVPSSPSSVGSSPFLARFLEAFPLALLFFPSGWSTMGMTEASSAMKRLFFRAAFFRILGLSKVWRRASLTMSLSGSLYLIQFCITSRKSFCTC
mmetsp:Transcript_6255/g.14435  ORF Transcript_6255/g.14435 Transcript_6255/m.14435 type:complete len:209 (-) Transcript_6255:72-698(-)